MVYGKDLSFWASSKGPAFRGFAVEKFTVKAWLEGSVFWSSRSSKFSCQPSNFDFYLPDGQGCPCKVSAN